VKGQIVYFVFYYNKREKKFVRNATKEKKIRKK
jgi:hypothetical protein